jgi:hypothetical protein
MSEQQRPSQLCSDQRHLHVLQGRGSVAAWSVNCPAFTSTYDWLCFEGVYVDGSGHTQQYEQPPESLGPITVSPRSWEKSLETDIRLQSIPYTASIPAVCLRKSHLVL